MIQENKRKYIEKYFLSDEIEATTIRKISKYGMFFFLLGILMFYLQAVDFIAGFTIMNVLFILTGLFSMWLYAKPYFSRGIFGLKIADGDMDYWFKEDLHEIIKPRALGQLRINPSSLKEENFIFVPHPVYWNYHGVLTETIRRKLGDDGSYIYTVWKVQILIATENFISYYSCGFDWTTAQIFDERTDEYFFEDIVSVKNDILPTDYNFIDNPFQNVGIAKAFLLSNKSGDKLTVITDIPSLKVPEGYSNNLEKLVQAVRILLRHRRFGEVPEITEKITTPLDDNGIEFEVERKPEEKDKFFFHQQLRELYNDYTKDAEQ
jgi:hypothetical protein